MPGHGEMWKRSCIHARSVNRARWMRREGIINSLAAIDSDLPVGGTSQARTHMTMSVYGGV